MNLFERLFGELPLSVRTVIEDELRMANENDSRMPPIEERGILELPIQGKTKPPLLLEGPKEVKPPTIIDLTSLGRDKQKEEKQ